MNFDRKLRFQYFVRFNQKFIYEKLKCNAFEILFCFSILTENNKVQFSRKMNFIGKYIFFHFFHNFALGQKFKNIGKFYVCIKYVQ